jgi:hypothetical protein
VVVRTLAFVVLRQVLSLISLGQSPDAEDIEIAVLRHQLLVLHRQVARPRYAPVDRMIRATLAKPAPPRSLADLPGHPIDPASLAPRADPPPLDLVAAEKAIRPAQGPVVAYRDRWWLVRVCHLSDRWR